ncbi:MAG: hypothetical protein ACRDP5_24120 [Streptosporangiaceae bacterium]
MLEICNTTISVLRGTTTDAYGDPADAATPALTGVPAFIGETGRKVEDPGTPTPRTIRQVTGRVPAWAGVKNTDQILDESTGDTYMVMAVTRPPALFGSPDSWPQVLDLKRVGASGT